MRRPTLLLAALATLAVAASTWWLLREPVLTSRAANDADRSNALMQAGSDAKQRASNEAPREEVEGLRAPNSDAATNEPRLRVRLRGVRPEAPWTEPVELRVFGCFATEDDVLFEATCKPDVDGRIVFSLPEWCAADSQGSTVHAAWLSAADPNYEPLEWGERFGSRPLDLARELVFDVELVGVLTGNVRNGAGEPVAKSRVVALALRDGQPLPGVIATAATNPDGSYRLLVPPDSPMCVVALPCNCGVTIGNWKSETHWWMTKNLLPATKIATALLGAPTTVPDFVLEPAAHVTGTLQWDDGTPIAYATVEALPRDGDTLPLADGEYLRRDADGRLAPGVSTGTNAQGAFVLPVLPRATIDVQLVTLRQRECPPLLGPLPRHSGSDAKAVAFTLPRPIVLRTRLDAEPLAHADVEVADQCMLRTGPAGELAVVAPAAVRVRASARNLRSAWYEIGPTDTGKTIDLILQSTSLTAVTIEVDDTPNPDRHTIRYRRDGGLESEERVSADKALELLLDPGRYHFAVVHGADAHRTIEDEVDVLVDAKPVSVHLRSSSGGTFAVKATDGHGAWLGGTCTVRDGAEREWRGRFQVQDSPAGQPGELLATGVNTFRRQLPPGDYELRCDFGAHGTHREVVTIRANETADVRIRLP